jgi:hypothetical protein
MAEKINCHEGKVEKDGRGGGAVNGQNLACAQPEHFSMAVGLPFI